MSKQKSCENCGLLQDCIAKAKSQQEAGTYKIWSESVCVNWEPKEQEPKQSQPAEWDKEFDGRFAYIEASVADSNNPPYRMRANCHKSIKQFFSTLLEAKNKEIAELKVEIESIRMSNDIKNSKLY